MKHNAFIINFGFFLIIALSILAIKHLLRNTVDSNIVNRIDTPDAYMLNASYLRTNEDGQRDLVMSSPHIIHYQHEDSSIIQRPDIKIYKDNQQWLITSKQAKSTKGIETFYFDKDVRAKQLPNKNKDWTLLTTQSLTIFPKKNLVTTKDFVTIEQPGLKINAKGLKGDLNTGNIQLLSKTKGQYDPKPLH